MEKKKERYDALDGLRTYAAIAVLVLHVLENGPYSHKGFMLGSIIPYWGKAVFLFMMISAFSMCCGYYNKILDNQIDIKQFYKKRFVKIWPIFALLCLMDIVISPSIESIYETFANLTMCFGLLPNHNISVIGVGWFLGVVFVFYMLFPFFCCLVSNKRMAWFSFIVALVMNILCEVYFFDDNHMLSSFVSKHSFIYCAVFFFVGALIYLHRKELSLISEKLRWGVFLASVAGTVLFYITKGSVYSMLIVFPLYIIYALGNKRKLLDNRFTKFISGISLEIYLSHMVVFRVLEKMKLVGAFGDSALSFVITSILTFIGSVLFSIITQKALEYFSNIVKKKCKSK